MELSRGCEIGQLINFEWIFVLPETPRDYTAEVAGLPVGSEFELTIGDPDVLDRQSDLYTVHKTELERYQFRYLNGEQVWNNLHVFVGSRDTDGQTDTERKLVEGRDIICKQLSPEEDYGSIGKLVMVTVTYRPQPPRLSPSFV